MKGRNLAAAIAAGSALIAVMAGHASAQTPLTTTRVASGLIRPIYVTHAPGDPTRLFIIEKQGFISILKDGVLLPTKFLDVDAITLGGTSTNSEQGLLGLAFDPDYATNGYFYIHHTQSGGGAAGHATVARYRVSTFNPDIADITTRVDIITLAKNSFTGSFLDAQSIAKHVASIDAYAAKH